MLSQKIYTLFFLFLLMQLVTILQFDGIIILVATSFHCILLMYYICMRSFHMFKHFTLYHIINCTLNKNVRMVVSVGEWPCTIHVCVFAQKRQRNEVFIQYVWQQIWIFWFWLEKLVMYIKAYKHLKTVKADTNKVTIYTFIELMEVLDDLNRSACFFKTSFSYLLLLFLFFWYMLLFSSSIKSLGW